MSIYEFLASDVMLENVKNEKVMFFSVKQALEKGITLNKKLIANIDENKKDVIMYLKKRRLGRNQYIIRNGRYENIF